jgi:hypothetical protein
MQNEKSQKLKVEFKKAEVVTRDKTKETAWCQNLYT